MGKTIKVIDFLIKKANKEELPKKVKFHNEIFVASDECYGEHINQEEDSDGSRRCLFEGWILGKILNDSVEIIEEDKEIEILTAVNGSDLVDLQKNSTLEEQNKSVTNLIMYLNANVEKTNELVRAVNELKKGK